MKVGIVGLGRMGRRHIKVVKHMGLKLEGVYDLREDSIKLAIDEENINSYLVCNSFEKLLDKKIDCLIIATTAPSHCTYTLRASEKKVPYILCEKPMATSIFECDEMINSCEKNKCKLAINHQMRFMEQYIKVKEIVSSKEFGGLSSVNIIAGNFGFAMNATHYFELFRYLTEEKPYEVTSWFSKEIVPNPRGEEFQDRAGQLRVLTRNGKRLYFEIGADQGHWILVTYAGKNGMIYADELNGKIYLNLREKEYIDYPTTKYALPNIFKEIKVSPPDIIESTAMVLKSLFEGKNYPSGEDGRNTILTLVAAYKSNENKNSSVKINDLQSHYEIKYPWA